MVEPNGPSHPETIVYCLTANGKFPADAYWPEYYHSALPVADQLADSWLKLKGAYSNGMWFPMPEVLLPSFAALLLMGLIRAARWRVACKWLA